MKRSDLASHLQETFALVRPAREQKLFYYQPQEESVKRLLCISELEPESQGFLFAPFQASSNEPIYFFEGVERQEIDLQELAVPPRTKARLVQIIDDGRKAYEKAFRRVHEAVRSGQFQKLVLSRIEVIALDESINPLELFVRAATQYPNAYVSLVHLPEQGYFLGATPELLLEGRNDHWHTMALAGTRSRSQTDAAWSRKNRDEQSWVRSFICQAIQAAGAKPQPSETYTVEAGQVEHLCTKIHFSTTEQFQLARFLERLHPTPAVCGLAQKAAKAFLLQHEQIDRAYYSGFLGEYGMNDQTALYVNLRCLQLLGDKCYLYAGGGIMPQSSLEEEWQETVQKMQTLKSILSQA